MTRTLTAVLLVTVAVSQSPSIRPCVCRAADASPGTDSARSATAAPATPAGRAGRHGTPPASIAEVLERYYRALGGREALEGVSSRVATGRVVDDRPWAGPAKITRFEAYGGDGGRWARVEHAPEGDFAEGFDGAVAWTLEDGEVNTSTEPNRSKLAFLLDPQGPIRIGEYFLEMRYAGVTTYEGRPVCAVETDRNPTYYTLYFDLETGLLTNIGYHWYVEDYRPVDGVLVPHRVVEGRKGGSVTHVFDEIVANSPVAGSRFNPPETGSGGR